MSGYIQELNKTEISSPILGILDKVEKIGEPNALASLQDLGLTESESENLIKLAKNTGKIEEIVKNLSNFSKNELFQLGLTHLQELDKYLKLMGTKKVVYDLSIIRGHDYYTGTVFEAFTKTQRLALGGGGRFDNLCSYFSEKKMPGVGMSVGITRLFDLLKEENFFKDSTNDIDCAVITFDETFDEGLKMTSQLRNQAIKADCFYENKSFKSKMKEANRRQVKYVIILGEDEIKTGEYTLKNMENSEQTKLSIEKIIELIKNDRM